MADEHKTLEDKIEALEREIVQLTDKVHDWERRNGVLQEQFSAQQRVLSLSRGVTDKYFALAKQARQDVLALTDIVQTLLSNNGG